MATMQVEVVSTEQRLLEEDEVAEVYARSLDGEIGILPGHQPVLLALDVAPVLIRFPGGDDRRIAVHGGFLFFRDNHLVILADAAELPDQIDVARAESRKRDVEAQLEADDTPDLRKALKRQDVRLDLARH